MSEEDYPTLSLPYFDNAPADVPEEVSKHPAFSRFLNLTPEDRRAHTRHVVAHYQDSIIDIPDDFLEEFFEEMGGAPEISDALWSHLPPGWVMLNIEDDGKSYIVVDCACPWDPDHGIAFSFENGTTLVMVGQYHDYPTNGDTVADDIVYAAIRPEFTTLRADNQEAR